MTAVLIDYATPSVFESDRQRALLGISANTRRPVRFHGRVRRDTFLLRVALRALGEAIWSADFWSGGDAVLDPVITVHPDRIFFEAFSQDQSVYAAAIVDPGMFETEGDVVAGTTNVDFSAWLWGALAELRTSRETWLRVGAEGFEVRTVKAGGRFEQKVDVPLPWVRGFLSVQAAMAMPGTRVSARPVDVLAALRYLRYTKAKVSPRALRYEFDPDSEVRLVLEPWEYAVPLKGSTHNYTEPRVIRTWGRRRLRLIEPLLPFADRVEIYLKGRAQPSFYAVKMRDITFVLGLSGFSEHAWTESGGHALLSACGGEDPAQLTSALSLLGQKCSMTAEELAETLAIDLAAATRLLVRLCRQGRVMYDVERRRYRHRELFEEPPDEGVLYPPDVRSERARSLIAEKLVSIASCVPRETRKVRRLRTPDGKIEREVVYRDWHVTGRAGGTEPVEVVVNEAGRIIFGTCACEFFKENLLNKGPCEHMLALYGVSESDRKDLPTSREVASEDAPAAPARPKGGEDGEGGSDELDSEE